MTTEAVILALDQLKQKYVLTAKEVKTFEDEKNAVANAAKEQAIADAETKRLEDEAKAKQKENDDARAAESARVKAIAMENAERQRVQKELANADAAEKRKAAEAIAAAARRIELIRKLKCLMTSNDDFNEYVGKPLQENEMVEIENAYTDKFEGVANVVLLLRDDNIEVAKTPDDRIDLVVRIADESTDPTLAINGSSVPLEQTTPVKVTEKKLKIVPAFQTTTATKSYAVESAEYKNTFSKIIYNSPEMDPKGKQNGIDLIKFLGTNANVFPQTLFFYGQSGSGKSTVCTHALKHYIKTIEVKLGQELYLSVSQIYGQCKIPTRTTDKKMLPSTTPSVRTTTLDMLLQPDIIIPTANRFFPDYSIQGHAQYVPGKIPPPIISKESDTIAFPGITTSTTHPTEALKFCCLNLSSDQLQFKYSDGSEVTQTINFNIPLTQSKVNDASDDTFDLFINYINDHKLLRQTENNDESSRSLVFYTLYISGTDFKPIVTLADLPGNENKISSNIKAHSEKADDKWEAVEKEEKNIRNTESVFIASILPVMQAIFLALKNKTVLHEKNTTWLYQWNFVKDENEYRRLLYTEEWAIDQLKKVTENNKTFAIHTKAQTYAEYGKDAAVTIDPAESVTINKKTRYEWLQHAFKKVLVQIALNSQSSYPFDLEEYANDKDKTRYRDKNYISKLVQTELALIDIAAITPAAKTNIVQYFSPSLTAPTFSTPENNFTDLLTCLPLLTVSPPCKTNLILTGWHSFPKTIPKGQEKKYIVRGNALKQTFQFASDLHAKKTDVCAIPPTIENEYITLERERKSGGRRFTHKQLHYTHRLGKHSYVNSRKRIPMQTRFRR